MRGLRSHHAFPLPGNGHTDNKPDEVEDSHEARDGGDEYQPRGVTLLRLTLERAVDAVKAKSSRGELGWVGASWGWVCKKWEYEGGYGSLGWSSENATTVSRDETKMGVVVGGMRLWIKMYGGK